MRVEPMRVGGHLLFRLVGAVESFPRVMVWRRRRRRLFLALSVLFVMSIGVRVNAQAVKLSGAVLSQPGAIRVTTQLSTQTSIVVIEAR